MPPSRGRRRETSTDVGVGPAGERTRRRRARRGRPRPGHDATEVEASPDGERRLGVSRHDASHQSDKRNTHQQLLHVTFPSFQFSPRRVPGRVMPPCERFHHSPSPSSSVPNGGRCEPRHGSAAGSHRSRCKDGPCRSPHRPAKCRRRCRAAPRRLPPARRPVRGRRPGARRQVLVANLRHRAVDVAVKAKPRHRGLLQAHAPQRPRIEPRSAAGIRDRGAEAESGPDKRAAAGNRPEARFEPGRGQARCDSGRHGLDRLIGRDGAVADDRRRRVAADADATQCRPAPRSPASSMSIWHCRRPSPSSSMIEPMQVRSPPSQRWQPTKAASCVFSVRR